MSLLNIDIDLKTFFPSLLFLSTRGNLKYVSVTGSVRHTQPRGAMNAALLSEQSVPSDSDRPETRFFKIWTN